MEFQEQARACVVAYFNDHVEVTDDKRIKLEDTYVVWFSKTLKNWKALVSTNVTDGMYYEVTYDGEKDRIYFDAYKKWHNQVFFPDTLPNPYN